MQCREFRELLDAYLDNELSPAEREALLAHARECSACADELASAEVIREALAHLDDDLRVPIAAQASWRAAVKAESKRRRGRTVYRVLSTVAAAFVLLAGTTAVFRATGVLDFDGQVAPTTDVHIATSAPRAEFYDIAPESLDASEEIAQARHAQIESDGATASDAGSASTEPTSMIASDAGDATAEPSSIIASDAEQASTFAGSTGGEVAAQEAAAQPEAPAAGGEQVAQEESATGMFVRSAVRELYSENFDVAHQSIRDLVEEYNGNIVTDTLNTRDSTRSATLAVDVPADELDAFLKALDFVAEVTYQSVSSQDISTNYYDAQGRLETLRLERDRLNELIATAADAQELQSLDAQLDEVYEQIDVLEGKLRNFDSQLKYARVDIVLYEGARLEATAITGGTGRTGGTAQEGLSRSLNAIGAFFRDMGVSLAVIAPYAGIAIALVAVVWVGVMLINRHRRHD